MVDDIEPRPSGSGVFALHPTEMLDAIRHATERADFTRAALLWEEWSRELTLRLAQNRQDDADWTRTTELYRWSKDVLVCARTELQDRLNTLHAAGAYGAQQLLGAATEVSEPRLRAPADAATLDGSAAPDAPR